MVDELQLAHLCVSNSLKPVQYAETFVSILLFSKAFENNKIKKNVEVKSIIALYCSCHVCSKYVINFVSKKDARLLENKK